MLKQAAELWNRLISPRPCVARPKLLLQTNPRDEDRRVWVRYPARSEAQVMPAGEEEPLVNGKVLDVSLGGAKLLVNHGFDEGSLISIDLPGDDAEPSGASVLACVVRAEQQSDDVWVLGCNFSRELDTFDLQWFGIAKAKPAEPDQRGWSRFECHFKAFYTQTSGETFVRRAARVSNLSAGGIGLIVDEDVPNGTLLSLDLHTADGELVTSILACVVHVRGLPEGGTALGCNFICELSEKHLNALMFTPVSTPAVTVS
jgi:hypothetical protein